MRQPYYSQDRVSTKLIGEIDRMNCTTFPRVDFDFKIWFRASNITGTFEKRVSAISISVFCPSTRVTLACVNIAVRDRVDLARAPQNRAPEEWLWFYRGLR